MERAMRVFLAGATGAIGRQLVPMLVDAGHQVTATTRSADRVVGLEAAGAAAVVVNAYDAQALIAAVVAARPAVVIHQLTDLGGALGAGLTDDQLARTAHLRIDGTTNLLDGAVAAGARRIVAQSIALLYARGPEPHTEADPLAVTEPWMAITLPGIVELERLVTTAPAIEGVVLRYGLLYGPGAGTEGPGTPPTAHVRAAARAAALAIDRGAPGIYNIVDNGGPVSNAKAVAQLGWSPAPDTAGQGRNG
jgi:nucleoside-diphosphate-sugar epimerase